MNDLGIISHFESNNTAAYQLGSTSQSNSVKALETFFPFLIDLVLNRNLSNDYDFGIHDENPR